MNIQQMRCVMAILDHNLNITEAADHLNITSAGLGKQLKSLEIELGMAIFVRHGKRLIGLTEDGGNIIESIERLLVEAEGIRSFAQQARHPKFGKLRIAITADMSVESLRSSISEFARLSPHTEIDIAVIPTDAIDRAIVRAACHFALSGSSMRTSPAVAAFPLYSGPLVAVVRGDHSLADGKAAGAADLAGYPLVAGCSAAIRRRLEDALTSAGVAAAFRLQTTDAEMIERQLRSTEAVAIVGAAAVPPAWRHRLVVLPIALHDLAPFEMWLSVGRAAALPDQALAFLDILAPHLAARRLAACLRDGVDQRPEAPVGWPQDISTP